MKAKYILLVSVYFLISGSSMSQSIEGVWKTIDDETGKARSVVEIFERDGKFFGKIIKLFREEGEDQDPTCTECQGDKKGKKIIGLEIIADMEYDEGDEEYSKGEILDPENGKVYDCKLWVEDQTLKVRGYVAFFYRTQTWLPYSGE